MADSLDDLLRVDPNGYARFLSTGRAIQEDSQRQQAIDQQQKFIRDRAALGANPTADQLQSLGMRNINDAKTLVDMVNKRKELVPITPSGLYERDTGNVIQPSPAEKPTPEVKPLIQMLPISNTHEQPHISLDNGKTFNPIPNSTPRPIFNSATALDPASIDANAKAISEYKLAPITGFAMRSPGGQQTMAKVMELNPEYDAKNFVTAQRTRNSFAVGPEGRTVRSFNVAIDHLDTLNDAADALKNGNIQRFNQLSQRVAQETGSPTPTNFDAIKSIVAKEIVKSVIGSATGGGVTERQELSGELSRANSPDQLKGMISRYQTLMAGQLKGLKQQYEAGRGGPDFEDKFLLPRSKQVFSRMQQPQDQGQSAYVEIRKTPSGKTLGRKADGTIEEIK